MQLIFLKVETLLNNAFNLRDGQNVLNMVKHVWVSFDFVELYQAARSSSICRIIEKYPINKNLWQQVCQCQN